MLLADRVLQQQYRARNYQVYTDLINVLLQAKKHDELLLRNHHKRPIGSAALPEVHYNDQNNKKSDGSMNYQMTSKGKSKRKRNKKKKPQGQEQDNGISKQTYDKSKVCHKCGCYKHTAKKCRTLRHLIDLYQKYGGSGQKAQGQRYEAHFNLQKDSSKEAGCSQTV